MNRWERNKGRDIVGQRLLTEQILGKTAVGCHGGGGGGKDVRILAHNAQHYVWIYLREEAAAPSVRRR